MSDKFEHIKSEVDKLAGIIGVPENLLPTYGNSKECHPNIELSSSGTFCYEIYERGRAIRMEYVLDIDHLLYLIFRDVTLSMASDYASKHSNPALDKRRTLCDYQLELLKQLNLNWQQREEENQKAIALQAPFNDYQGLRQSYLRELLGSGFLLSEAMEKVNQKYP